MRTWQRVGLTLTLCAICLLSFAGRTIAENVTVTIGVGDTILTVQGKTSPDAFVTIRSDGNVIGTTTAATDGTYSATFPAQSPGIHELNIYAHSTGGYNTDTVTLNINITEHGTTTVEVFLPTTLVINDATLSRGQPLEVHGETFPLSTIKVFINNTDFVTTTANAQGLWSASVDTTSLAGGEHEFFVRASDTIGNQSYPTALRTFSLEATPNPTPTPTPTAPAEVPPSPKITFPASNTAWDKPQITITGTAAPGVQVELWDGTRPLGSVWSNAKGEWSITLNLEAKEYLLRARACMGGTCSAFSPTIIVTYTPSTPISPLLQPLLIELDPLSYTVFEAHPLTIRPRIVSGQPPYKTTMQWGDSKSTNNTHVKDELEMTHSFAKPGKYSATLFAEDAQGRKGSVEFTIQVLPRASTNWWPAIAWWFLFAAPILALVWLARRKILAVQSKDESSKS